MDVDAMPLTQRYELLCDELRILAAGWEQNPSSADDARHAADVRKVLRQYGLLGQ